MKGNILIRVDKSLSECVVVDVGGGCAVGRVRGFLWHIAGCHDDALF
jgi:hypothetical protein